MPLLASLAGLGLVLALLSGIMAWAMIKAPDQGFFRPVLIGFIPVAFFLAPMLLDGDWRRGETAGAVMKAYHEQMNAVPPPPEVDKEEYKKQVEALGQSMLELWPAIEGVLWLGLLTFSAWVLRRWLVRKGKVSEAPALITWKASDLVIWALLLPAMLWLITDRGLLADESGQLKLIALNLVVIVSAVYFFQGFQVFRWQLKKAPGWVKGLLVATMVIISGSSLGRSMLVMITMVGLFDVWFDLRRLNPPEDKKIQKDV